MRSVEELNKELDEITKETFEKAQELSDVMHKYENVDLGEVSDSEDDQNNYRGFRAAIDMRRQAVLKRMLVEWGGLLYL